MDEPTSGLDARAAAVVMQTVSKHCRHPHMCRQAWLQPLCLVLRGFGRRTTLEMYLVVIKTEASGAIKIVLMCTGRFATEVIMTGALISWSDWTSNVCWLLERHQDVKVGNGQQAIWNAVVHILDGLPFRFAAIRTACLLTSLSSRKSEKFHARPCSHAMPVRTQLMSQGRVPMGI